MATIIPFRQGDALQTRKPDALVNKHSRLLKFAYMAGRSVGTIGVGLLKTLHYLIFLVMLWLRGLIRIVLRLTSSLAMIAFFIGLFVNSDNKAMDLGMLAGLSFGCAAAAWAYDGLLVRIAPAPIILD